VVKNWRVIAATNIHLPFFPNKQKPKELEDLWVSCDKTYSEPQAFALITMANKFSALLRLDNSGLLRLHCPNVYQVSFLKPGGEVFIIIIIRELVHAQPLSLYTQPFHYMHNLLKINSGLDCER
jgi:hypothetical protein